MANATSLARPMRLAVCVLLIYWTAQYVDILSLPSTRSAARLRVQETSITFGEERAAAADLSDTLERCAGHSTRAERNSFVDYERFVYCTRLGDSLLLARTVLVVILVVLLYLLSSTADSFFCPILQAIVEKYRIPPDIAGVTFLSFGNGSPDVFSNIAAFSTATPKIGVTSILGGGLLVTTVIAASVGLASQDQDPQLIPRKFVRDVVFYFVAVSYFCFVFYDGTVELYEALGFLGLYACYVCLILLDKQLARQYYAFMGYNPDEISQFEPTKQLLVRPFPSGTSWSSSEMSASDSEEHPAGTPMVKDYEVFRVPNYTPASDSDEPSETFSMGLPLVRKSSAPTPRSKKVLDGHFEQPPQGEAVPLLWHQHTSVPRPASVCVPSLTRRRRRTAWESTQLSARSNLTAKRWTRWYHELNDIAEITGISETGDDIEEDDDARTREGSPQSHASPPVEAASPSSPWERYLFRWFRAGYFLFDRFLWNPLEFSTTFVRRLTIPLVDDETWDKTFAMACPPCALLLAGVSVFKLNPLTDLLFAGIVVLGGGAGSVAVYLTASPLAPPGGSSLAPYICLAFVMSVIWIMNIANEVLALLKVLGGLFGLSNSVLGVSVLAWGNSIGDLVSNTSIARDGFPTMAFAGCFAGPMFNLLVGIGLALTLAILSRGPISMGTPTQLEYIGFGFLFASILLNLGFAACDGFRYRPRLCYTLYIFYASFVAISIAAVVMAGEL